MATTPSAVAREAALLARFPSLTRRISSALPMSPPASARAFLQSIIGASVRSRSSLTMPAVISAIYPSLPVKKKGLAGPSNTVLEGPKSGPLGILDFHEFFAAADDLLETVLLALEHRVRDAAHVEADRPARIIVAWDHVSDALRRMIGIHYGNYRDAELLGLRHGPLLVPDIDYEYRVRQAVHVLDTAHAAIELGDLALVLQRFLLGQFVHRAILHHGFHFLQPLDRLLDRLVIGEHAAQPAVIDERRAGAQCLFLDDLAGLALG